MNCLVTAASGEQGEVLGNTTPQITRDHPLHGTATDATDSLPDVLSECLNHYLKLVVINSS